MARLTMRCSSTNDQSMVATKTRTYGYVKASGLMTTLTAAGHVECHMNGPFDALISAHRTSGEARVGHADVAPQLEALHPQCFGWAMAWCGHRRGDAEDVLRGGGWG